MPHAPALLLAAALAPAALAAQVPFGEPVTLAGPLGSPDSSKLVDLDGDGALDVLVASRTSHRVRIARGRAGADAGTFELPAVLFNVVTPGAVDEPRIAWMDVANLDADAELEVCVIRHSGTVEVYDEGSGGEYSLAATITGFPVSNVARLQLTDVDGDGLIDVTSYPFVVMGEMRWAKGMGGFQFAAPAPVFTSAVSFGQAIFFDADGDGDQDLAVRSEIRGGAAALPLVVHRNIGALPFDPAAGVSISVGPQGNEILSFIAAEDADSDGLADIISGGGYSSSVQVHLGAGLLSGASSVDVPLGFAPRRATVGDFNGDGFPDLAAGSNWTTNTPSELEWARGRGPGAGWDAGTPFGFGEYGLEKLSSADLDGSGGVDLVRLSANAFNTADQEGFDVFLASGSPAAPFDAGTANGERLGETILVAGDLNGDGTVDLVLEGPAGDRTFTKMGFGDGTFGEREPIPALFDSPVLADVTGDGALDLLSYEADNQAQTYRLTVSRNLGDGRFAGPVTAVPMPTPTITSGIDDSLRVLDLDGDGDLDVSFVENAAIWPVTALNRGDGTFDPPQLFTGSSGPGFTRIEFDDLNGDGLVDFVISYDFYIGIGLGIGGGRFAPRTEISTAGTAVRALMHLADIDQDGWSDIVYVTAPGGAAFSVEWLRNQAGAGFDAPVTLFTEVSDPAYGTQLADFDLDGDPDLLSNTRLFHPGRLLYRENLGGGIFAPPTAIRVTERDKARLTLLDVDGDGDEDALMFVKSSTPSTAVDLDLLINTTREPVGDRYCVATAPNSSGLPGRLDVLGSELFSAGALILVASDLPSDAIGFFLTSRTSALVTAPPGSIGTLCLGGAIGRFVGPGQTLSAGPLGTFRLSVDGAAIPDPQLGIISAQVGETWRFQAWHRDTAGGSATSNFTDAVAVTFR